MNLCEANHLCKTYPGFALQDLSFNLPAGTITGFIGRNGAGKTTTIKAMLGRIRPDAGDVRYFGLPLTANEDAIKQRIGYSSGTVNYYPKKRIRDLAAVTARFYEGWDEQIYRSYLRRFALDENKTPSQLSEGMKVKCNLLLALSHGAELLILDEPTSGVDPFSRDELTDIFLDLKERGVTILFSTHITSDIEKCADRMMYIRNGQPVYIGEKAGFVTTFSHPEETLEQTILRLEKESDHETSAL